MHPKTEADFDQIIADHIAEACQTTGDDDLFADVSDAAEVLGDRSDWSGFNGGDSLTDREWMALERAAERWIVARWTQAVEEEHERAVKGLTPSVAPCWRPFEGVRAALACDDC